MKNVTDIFSNFHTKKILVIGDVMLDVYLNGSSSRLTPEAPVPVVDVETRKKHLGGAGNTACNFRSLGAEVTLVSATGDDYGGEEIKELLADLAISDETILSIKQRTSLVKTRLASGGQVIARYDRGTTTPLSDEDEEVLIGFISENYEHYDAIVISDYDKGIVTETMVQTLKRLQLRHNKFLAVDSKRLTFFSILQPDFVKPNYEEAVKLLGVKPFVQGRREQIVALGDLLGSKTNARIVSVTLDKDGSVFFKGGEFVHHSDAPVVASPHVSGAGDTFLAAFVLAFAARGDVETAAEIATGAAAIAIQKESTASCFIHELKRYFQTASKCIHASELKVLCDQHRQEGKRIVFTNGCFDILHSGHVGYLRRARMLGDVLIVGINTDESIRRIKGHSRPVNTLDDRIEVLSALSFVDHVVAFGSEEEDTPAELIQLIKPRFFVKGGDYDRDKLPEAEVVEQSGGEIIFIPLVPDHSTTSIIQKINSFKETGAFSLADHE
jgi:D-beta-D-heptose 7-phosphate kinase/D-beta-D-heptose 1-phosphate adenosyltransferase